MIRAIVVAEGEFAYMMVFPSELAAEWYSQGLYAGGELYGSGSLYLLTAADLGQFGEREDDLIRRLLIESPPPPVTLPTAPTPPPGETPS